MEFTSQLLLIKKCFVLVLYRPKNVILTRFFLMYKNCFHPECLFTIISSNFNSHEFLLSSLNLSQNELFSFLGKMFKQPGPRTAGISPPTTICARFTYGRPATLPKLPSLFVHGYCFGPFRRIVHDLFPALEQHRLYNLCSGRKSKLWRPSLRR